MDNGHARITKTHLEPMAQVNCKRNEINIETKYQSLCLYRSALSISAGSDIWGFIFFL